MSSPDETAIVLALENQILVVQSVDMGDTKEGPCSYLQNFDSFSTELGESQGVAAERALPADSSGDGRLLRPLRGPGDEIARIIPS